VKRSSEARAGFFEIEAKPTYSGVAAGLSGASMPLFNVTNPAAIRGPLWLWHTAVGPARKFAQTATRFRCASDVSSSHVVYLIALQAGLTHCHCVI
jgi:uncharacterized protein YvpB